MNDFKIVVLIGEPNSGCGTTQNVIKKRGHICLEEVATRHWGDLVAEGKDPHIERARDELASQVLIRYRMNQRSDDLKELAEARVLNGRTVFVQRWHPDSDVYIQLHGGNPDRFSHGDEPFYRAYFFRPLANVPFEDWRRTETSEQRTAIGNGLREIYGDRLVDVPPGTPEQMADFILCDLGLAKSKSYPKESATMKRIVVGSDIEYTLARRDFAFEVLARVLGDTGKKAYAALSSFDDVLGQAPDVLEDGDLRALALHYVVGTTPLLIMPIFSAMCDFNDRVVEDLVAITDLRVNYGVPDLIAGLQQDGAHVALISSSCDSFARRNAQSLNLPYFYASISGRQDSFSTEVRHQLRELACDLASCEIIEFQGNSVVRTEKNLARVRSLAELFKRLAQYVDLPALAQSAMGGARKVEALKHAAEYANGQFGKPLPESWMTKVMYLGDSITDEVVIREVGRRGGLSVSVNGNDFALAGADVAVVSRDLSCLRGLGSRFDAVGKAGVLDEIAARPDDFAERGIFLNDRTPALRTLSGNMRAALKGEQALIN